MLELCSWIKMSSWWSNFKSMEVLQLLLKWGNEKVIWSGFCLRWCGFRGWIISNSRGRGVDSGAVGFPVGCGLCGEDVILVHRDEDTTVPIGTGARLQTTQVTLWNYLALKLTKLEILLERDRRGGMGTRGTGKRCIHQRTIYSCRKALTELG